MNDLSTDLPLGKETRYKDQYDPGLLSTVPRYRKREEIGLLEALPFTGVDIWNAYELSWLNPQGKPMVAMGEFRFPCTNPNMIESKSFKLYLNSFNQTVVEGFGALRKIMITDLGKASGGPVEVRLVDTASFATERVAAMPGESVDDLDIPVNTYDYDPQLLAGSAPGDALVAETLHSHLLKSNCLITSQPDWASVMIRYRGARIDRASLLRYLISFRLHNEFHEQCVERIFADLSRFCQPEQLTVYARYTRRGGLDINPFRSNFESDAENLRLARQ